ncbi:CMGC/CDK protein kinase [Helicocarpus griseus UAMH5409]|uniref:CMGC/CDK protein kinase n=1 Tax=Helicocarpus griseus UAMH5409 TaxID=1447875 RepID=A0A2B7Y4L1_9EURO|nr:CMGC/CDK protein kinase [Helicocarpus griseus UAMH5409]
MGLFKCLRITFARALRIGRRPRGSSTDSRQRSPYISSTTAISERSVVISSPVNTELVRDATKEEFYPPSPPPEFRIDTRWHSNTSNGNASLGLSPDMTLFPSPVSSRLSTPLSNFPRTTQTRVEFESSNTTVGNISCSNKSLRAALEAARVETPPGSHKYFVPRTDLEDIITESKVTHNLKKEGVETDEAVRVANWSCRYARQLFAILVCIKRSREIISFLNEKISDDDLPFKRVREKGKKYALRRKNGAEIESMSSWKDRSLEKFSIVQWWMTAPVFNKEHMELDDNHVLPFLPLDGDEQCEPKRGGYSQVYKARLHPAHYNFGDLCTQALKANDHLVAVKELNSTDLSEFEKERTILTKLNAKGGSRNSHLINLLGSFQKGQKYHLLFCYADANLMTYWEERPTPDFRENVLWSLQQMSGIADGLYLIHNYRVTLILATPGGMRSSSEATLSVDEKENIYGRHGDIKPGNILWFKNMAIEENPKGILQIADLGLGRFHGRESRSGISPTNIGATQTYEPPECKLHRKVSRAYDIWSLGCLYLEFITWLLKGSEDINEFANLRAEQDRRIPVLSDDTFFTITDANNAEVRKAVNDWVHDLRQAKTCSQAIHDLLDLIMDQLLVIDAQNRIRADMLVRRLREILERASSDVSYLLDPVPRRRGSSATAQRQRNRNSRSSVFATIPEEGSQSGVNFQ